MKRSLRGLLVGWLCLLGAVQGAAAKGERHDRVLLSDPHASSAEGSVDVPVAAGSDAASPAHAARTLSSDRARGAPRAAGPATAAPPAVAAPLIIPEIRLSLPGAAPGSQISPQRGYSAAPAPAPAPLGAAGRSLIPVPASVPGVAVKSLTPGAPTLPAVPVVSAPPTVP